MPRGTFSATLTTRAFDPSRLRWFAPCSCKPSARGQCFSHLLRRLLRHTDIGAPELIDPSQLHAASQVQEDLELGRRIRGHHEGARLNGHEIVFTHDPGDPLVIDEHPPTPQLRGDAAVAITPSMLDRDRLNRGPHLHILLDGRAGLEMPITAGATDLRQLTHPLDAQVALQRHHFLDLVVDAFTPERPVNWRRASTFCKAPLKKSTSRVLSTSTRLS